MIERFSSEELAIIKKELGISEKTAGSKSFLLSEQKSRLMKLMKDNKRIHADVDCWDALLMICDSILENYYHSMECLEGITVKREKYHRYSSIWDPKLNQYKQMMNDLLDVMERNKKR